MILAPLRSVMRPCPNGQIAAIARSKVDLPQPLGPVMSTRSPVRTAMSSAAISGAPCGSRTIRLLSVSASSPSRAVTSMAGVVAVCACAMAASKLASLSTTARHSARLEYWVTNQDSPSCTRLNAPTIRVSPPSAISPAK